MKMERLLDMIYAVKQSELPSDKEFIREPSTDGTLRPLLHICERDNDPTQHIKTMIIICEQVHWDFVKGWYMCAGCKKTFSSPQNLRKVWEDGHGVGIEGHT